jgi:hypothetical protein
MEPTNRIPYHIDQKTARSIREWVGYGLQQDFCLETSPLPLHLARLVDELRKQERHPISDAKLS